MGSGTCGSGAVEVRRVHHLTLEGFSSRGLAPFDLTLSRGECLTIAGPSGCGKSLLLRAIADLDPHQGECVLEGIRRSQTPPPAWRSRVGLLPAESHWWTDRVGDHFSETEPGILQTLGFDRDCLDWSVARLSSGERQRLSLARLLNGRPQVLLLDEPTANLDVTNTERVEQLITAFLNDHEASAIWVSHDPAQRQRVGDRGLVFEGDALGEESWN